MKGNIMFNRLETAWNSRTPVYLHNGTKQNIIFQLTLAVVVLGVMIAHDEYKSRRDFPEMYNKKTRKS